MQNTRKLVAVVDDDEAVRNALAGLIRSLGFSVEAFSSAQEFLTWPHLNSIGFLIADVNMPGMSGLDLHCHLSALNTTIPTVLITAYPNEAVRARALQAGVAGFLMKPFREDDLVDRIRAVLRPE